MKRIFLAAIAMIVALTSCQHERLEDQSDLNSEGQSGGALSFSTYSQKTKGKVAYLDTLEAQGFAVWGFENDPGDDGTLTFFNVNKYPNFFGDDQSPTAVCFQDVNHTSGLWEYQPIKYWPENNLATLDFIAMCPREITYGDEGRWVYTPGDTTSKAKAKWGNFRVNPSIGEQTDLLVATKFNVPEVPKVVLEFTHALSRLGFAAYTPDTNKTIKITRISLHNVSTTDVENPVGFFQDRGSIELWVENSSSTGGATFPMNWNTATNGETKYNLSFQLGPDDMADSGRVAKQITRLNNDDKYIMVIPTNRASDLEIYIEYDVYLDKSATPSHKSKKFACPVYEFEMGKAYLFNFNLSMNEVKFDCTVVPWDESAYSLNAGADVNASSDRDGFEVYVDAQRSSKLSGGKAVTVTTYSLYAEMGEDENDNYMIPVWKTYNKWGSDVTGYELPVGELIDIYFNLYLNKLDLGEYGEVTMEEVELDGKRYTKLSFTIEETTGSDSKKAFAGNYVAHYISEPIIASMAEGGVKDTVTTKIIENGVKVNRSYSAWPLDQTISKNKQVPPPYETKVTLEITGTSQLGFEGWYKATGKYDSQGKDIWTKLDVTSSGSPYKEGTGHSLIFSETILNVDGTDSVYVSLDGKYRAVFGEASSGNIAIKFDKDDSHSQSISPNAAQFAAGEKVTLITDAPDEGFQIKWYAKVPGSANDWYLEFDNTTNTTTLDGITYTRSTTEDSKQQWVTFKVDKKQDGYVFYTKYTTNVNVALNGTSTMGATMVANTHYKRVDDADNNTVITFYPSAITNFQFPEVYNKTKDDWIPATVLTEQGVITFANDVLTVPGSQYSKIKTMLGTTDVQVRVNDHTYYIVDLGDYLSTYSNVLWEKSDGTTGAADARQLKVDNNVAITLYHADTDSTIFGFRISKGESVHKDTCELKANYPGHTTTMYAVPGRPLRVVSNSSSEFGLQCDGCEIASFGPGVSKNVVVPLTFINGVQIFDYVDIFTEDKSALVDVIASDGSTTYTVPVDETRPDWHPKVWFLTTVFPDSEYLSVKIQPKNGTQKLIEGGDLF